MSEEEPDLTTVAIWAILVFASCCHVFADSKRDSKIGHPWRHAMMCAFVLWPVPYLCWLFWWPGRLRQVLFGPDKRRAQRWAEQQLMKTKTNFWANGLASFTNQLDKEEQTRVLPLRSELKTTTDVARRAQLKKEISDIRTDFKKRRKEARCSLFVGS